MRIAVVDYGAGNTANVINAFGKLGTYAMLVKDASGFGSADALVLPGVGSFGPAMGRVERLRGPLCDSIAAGTPFLGICLGMQLLMDASAESPGVRGLGLIPGQATRFGPGLPVPHMGWNLVEDMRSALFQGMESCYAYFVHSYYCVPEESGAVAATTEYGPRFASAFAWKNVFATQFHPEKSGRDGLQMLSNFISEVKK